MATIEPYTTQSGRRYQVRYRTPDHRQTKKRGFRTKRDAEAYAATIEVSKLTGAYIQPSLGRITVTELAPEWLARKESDVAPSNYRTLDAAWRVHVKPKWGTRRVVDIELGEVKRWIADMGRTITDAEGKVTKKGAGATTIIRAYGVLAGILDDAVKGRRLAANPARGVENLPRKRRAASRTCHANGASVTSTCRRRTSPGLPTSQASTAPWCSRWPTQGCDGVS